MTEYLVVIIGVYAWAGISSMLLMVQSAPSAAYLDWFRVVTMSVIWPTIPLFLVCWEVVPGTGWVNPGHPQHPDHRKIKEA